MDKKIIVEKKFSLTDKHGNNSIITWSCYQMYFEPRWFTYILISLMVGEKFVDTIGWTWERIE